MTVCAPTVPDVTTATIANNTLVMALGGVGTAVLNATTGTREMACVPSHQMKMGGTLLCGASIQELAYAHRAAGDRISLGVSCAIGVTTVTQRTSAITAKETITQRRTCRREYGITTIAMSASTPLGDTIG
jgi:hypothetical protein